jgi:hypothetical protein
MENSTSKADSQISPLATMENTGRHNSEESSNSENPLLRKPLSKEQKVEDNVERAPGDVERGQIRGFNGKNKLRDPFANEENADVKYKEMKWW